MRGEVWVSSEDEAAGCFGPVEPSSEIILLLRCKHFRFPFEDKELVFMKTLMDYFEIGVREIVDVDSEYSRPEIDVAFRSMAD